MENDKPLFQKKETFLDCTGKLLEFEIVQGPQTDGVVLDARQIAPTPGPGYSFSMWSATPLEALGALRHKIKDGLSRRYMAEHPQRGLMPLTNELRGVISAGSVTIDGRRVSFDWLLTHLQTHEGFELELKIKDPAL